MNIECLDLQGKVIFFKKISIFIIDSYAPMSQNTTYLKLHYTITQNVMKIVERNH
jgi:hypothetical protein